MNEKAKNRSKRLSPINFVLLWICLTVATTYSMAGLLNWLTSFGAIGQFVRVENWGFFLISNLLVGGSIALVQKRVMQLGFGRTFNGWMRASFLGIILGFLPTVVLYLFNLQHLTLYQIEPYSSLIHILNMVLVALPQAWILRNYVKQSWLYVLGKVFGGFLVSLIIQNYFSDFASLSGVALQNVFVALSLLWLFRDSAHQEKAKVDEAETHARLEDTLEDHEEEEVVETIDYEREAER
jgi:hypothetical protein